jgi:ParB-like chromosome segregation protein Spo0J
MNTNKNDVRTICVREIEKSPELALGVPQKNIAKYENVIHKYGNVAPAVVAPSGQVYRLLDGHACIEAYTRAGVENVPVVVTNAKGEAEQMLLSLMLMSSKEQGGALGEGVLIDILLTNHGQTLSSLSELVGRSKAWLSKRQTMVKNISDPVRGMVLGGTLCARTAEEITRLPRDEQAQFAANVVKERLNKDDVRKLVRLYRSPDATAALCHTIIESPVEAIGLCPTIHRTRARAPTEQLSLKSMATKIAHTRHLVDDIADFVEEHERDGTVLCGISRSLSALRKSMDVLSTVICAHVDDESVSPGKRGCEK